MLYKSKRQLFLKAMTSFSFIENNIISGMSGMTILCWLNPPATYLVLRCTSSHQQEPSPPLQ